MKRPPRGSNGGLLDQRSTGLNFDTVLGGLPSRPVHWRRQLEPTTATWQSCSSRRRWDRISYKAEQNAWHPRHLHVQGRHVCVVAYNVRTGKHHNAKFQWLGGTNCCPARGSPRRGAKLPWRSSGGSPCAPSHPYSRTTDCTSTASAPTSMRLRRECNACILATSGGARLFPTTPASATGGKGAGI